MPGTTHAAAVAEAPPAVTETMSPLFTPTLAAVAADMRSALSQVILVTTSGSSCSQPMLAKRPSCILPSQKKTSSRPSASVRASIHCAIALPARFGAGVASRPDAVPSQVPRSSEVRKCASKSVPDLPLTAMCVRRTRSSPERTSSPESAATISSALRPPSAESRSAATSGCVIDTVPSVARVSPQFSRKWVIGTCQVQPAARDVSSTR